MIVNQKVELLEHNMDPREFIERVARTCYKSEKHIKPGSADKLVAGLVKAKHLAMLEHEYIYISTDLWALGKKQHLADVSHVKFLHYDVYKGLISGSYRAWMEWVEHVKMFTSEFNASIINALHEYDKEIFQIHFEGVDELANVVPRYCVEQLYKGSEKPCDMLPHTIRFTTSRAIANELVRHRNNIVFAQESQRYVDYNKNGDIEIITPLIDPESAAYNDWNYAMIMAKTQYFNLRKQGIAPEIARGVLPNDCKTEIVATATEDEWQHIVNLRYYGTTGAPHPQMKQLMEMALPLLNKASKGRIQ